MSHARIEEVSDSDPEIEDPSDYLPSSDQSIIQAVNPASSSSKQSSTSTPPVNPTLFRPPPPTAAQQQNLQQSRETIKTYQTLYPIYFDVTRTRAQGRRVSSKYAVEDPLAYNLLAAVRSALGNYDLPLAFEPDRTHPKDWSNPGRVRIQLYDKDTHKPLHPNIKSKAHLYTLVGKYLKDHPTKPADPLQFRIQGLPVPEKFNETEVARPRGWKMGKILPVHSCAVSGGGVRDDFFKEAMEELKQAQAGGGGGAGMPDLSALQGMMGGMGGMGMPGIGGPAGGGGDTGGGRKKKDKKKG